MPDGTTKTTRYLGKAYERTLTVAPGGSTTTEDRYFIHAAGRLVAIHTENRTDNLARNRFLHRDALGTVTLITDALGQVVERYASRPFGERAVIEPPGDLPGWTIPAGVTPRLKRGFTGHEHIEGVGLIHMNGRVYDPRLGRFLSADPNVQFLDQPRSYNRYVYAQNNPLKYTDPSGHFITAIAAIALTAGLKAVGLHIVAAAFIATTVVSLAAGADVETALKNGVFAAASAWAAQGIIQGGLDLAPAARTIANGIAQGAISEAAGGEFRSGFIGAVAGVTLGNVDIGLSGDSQVIQAAVVGGTVSKLSGGEFANGAATGAFAWMVKDIGSSANASPSASDITDAKLAQCAYEVKCTGADGYRLVKRFDEDNGLQAALFVKGDDRVLAYAGTDPGSWANWKSNLRQAFGFKSVQYDAGINLAIKLKSTYGNLRLTGHSLGGGIASAAAIVTGRSATTFNAVGVHDNTLRGFARSNGTIRAYHSSFDVLQIGNALTPGSVAGQRISLGAAGFHGMDGVCRAMGC